MKWRFRSFHKVSWLPYERASAVLLLFAPSIKWVTDILTQLTTPFCSQLLHILSFSFRNPALKASDTPDTPPSVVLCLQKWERPCCCFCSSNEMPSDLFMNYLFGTAPLCSVHFFLSSLESCRSVIADATLCHPEFALTSCEPSGRAISILACPRVCWRWEWLIKQVWASTPILLHAKQELSGS